ncbi:Uncharacterized protein BM_BM12805 [Brugia malayi]|uniref:Bm12805, isoform a n=2 Tax=Brugia TaxID=6278 RepID=A0A0K0IVV2_BRUMA|nr:Uncharacterized protein BM_BM12805 [Brugia malayi]CDQ01873.1 Bm12805, isoform b [Brugia malayi]VIO95987.1 Uncharacterized protein BM_BM12805 [Brugia malayi]
MTEPNQGNGMTDSTTIVKTVKRRNRCCCSLLHVTTATLLIGCLELCYFSYEIFSTVHYFIQTGEQYLLSLSISLFGILLALIASVLLFVAIKTSTPYLLVPHLLMQAAAICILLLICLFCLFALIAGTSLDFRIVNAEDGAANDLALIMAGKSTYELIYISRAFALILSFICIFLFLFGLVQIWMLITVFRCFFHLQEKAILKTQCKAINRVRSSSKRQNCTANDAKNNNSFSLEMNSTKVIGET